MRRLVLLLVALAIMTALFTTAFPKAASAHPATPHCSGFTLVGQVGGINGILNRWSNNCTLGQHAQLIGFASGHRFYVDITNESGGFADTPITVLGNGQSLNTAEIPLGSAMVACGEDVTTLLSNCV